MKIHKSIVGILIVSFLSCNDSKDAERTLPPKVDFENPDISEIRSVEYKTHVNDLEKLFSKDQNDTLEIYLYKLEKECGVKIFILTVPSKETLIKRWSIENGFTNDGILITISTSLKIVGIGISKENVFLSESIRSAIIETTIIPEFEKHNYYYGVKNGIEEILRYSK